MRISVPWLGLVPIEAILLTTDGGNGCTARVGTPGVRPPHAASMKPSVSARMSAETLRIDVNPKCPSTLPDAFRIAAERLARGNHEGLPTTYPDHASATA